MIEYKINQQARGTRLIRGNDRRALINHLINIAMAHGFEEIILPSVEPVEIYTEKAGHEIVNQLYAFPDRKNRPLCLRPEGTATLQILARDILKYEKDIKLFYEVRCWRYERPQAGRYREFTQFGVEVLNPTTDWQPELIEMARQMILSRTDVFEINESAKRGLAYYAGDGFEMSCPELGAQKQVVGGGRYAEGIGFAVGIDRLMLTGEKSCQS
jgi:histidyl-tRNA synthetase